MCHRTTVSSACSFGSLSTREGCEADLGTQETRPWEAPKGDSVAGTNLTGVERQWRGQAVLHKAWAGPRF